MDTMPASYTVESSTRAETTTTASTHAGNTSTIGVNMDYLRSLLGILKIVEVVVDIILWICVGTVPGYWLGGGGWVNFVAAISFIMTIILFVFHLINFIYRLPGPWRLIEVIIDGCFTGLFLIAMIVAACTAGYGSGAIAAAVFCFVNTVLYAVEFFFNFQAFRAHGPYLNNTQAATTGAAYVAKT